MLLVMKGMQKEATNTIAAAPETSNTVVAARANNTVSSIIFNKLEFQF